MLTLNNKSKTKTRRGVSKETPTELTTRSSVKDTRDAARNSAKTEVPPLVPSPSVSQCRSGVYTVGNSGLIAFMFPSTGRDYLSKPVD